MQLPEAVAFQAPEGHVRPVLAALRAKAFQQAMQLIAYLRGVVEHPRMAALVLREDVQQQQWLMWRTLFAFAPDGDVLDRVLQGRTGGHSVTLAAK